MTKKLISIALLLTLMVALLFGDYYSDALFGQNADEDLFEDALILWYTDSDYAEYLRDAAVSYEQQTGIKVIPTEVSDVEFLEQIQKASTEGNKAPDLFVLTNDLLEKAVLSGLAGRVKDPNHVLNSAFYADASLRAVTYRNEMYGYPLSYETACIVYNETVMEEIALAAKKAEEEGVDDSDGFTVVEENAEDSSEEDPEIPELTPEEKAERRALAGEILPTSVVGILDFANQYSLPAGIESYFSWDTDDVLYNYWFAGAYLNVGGENADLSEEISIYNEEALYSLSVYQAFRNFFFVEDDDRTYPDTINDFMNRKCLFTVAGTDIVGKIAAAKTEGTFADDYEILPIGMLNNNLKSRGLSVTTMICVNGLNENNTDAEKFADFATREYAKNLYARCGKMATAKLKKYEFTQMETIRDCYEQSVSLPKMVETTNYYILAEMCFANIWDGKDVNKELKSLSEQVLANYYGKDYTDDYIETPVVQEQYNAEGEN